MLAMEFRDTIEDFFEANGVGIPHGTAAMRRKTVTIQINNVDIGSAQRVTFFQNAGTLVDECIDRAIGDFLSGDFTLHNSSLGNPLANELMDRRVRDCPPLVVIFVPTRSGLLPESTEFTQTIFGEGLTNAGHFQVPILLSNAPANVETCEIADGERPHGIAEIDESLIHGFNASTFFDEELCFTAVGTKHAIADEASTVANEHSHFAERL